MTGIRWRGHRACSCVAGFTADVEKRLGKTLHVYQGSYSTGVAASSGTHAGGGAVDFATYDARSIRVMRECGGAAWHRTPAQGFIHHAHVIVLGCPHVSPAARDQQAQYQQGRNGLANRGPDDGPRVPYITWAAAHKALAGVTIQGKTYPAIAHVSVFWTNAARAAKGRYVSRHAYYVQSWLHKTRFYNAPIDGRWSAATQAAFDRFRANLGWKGSDIVGPVGISSMTKLRAKSGTGPTVRAR